MPDPTPRRFRWPIPADKAHPNGSDARWRHGCYFPLTHLLVTDMAERGTGIPAVWGLEWLDEPPDGEPSSNVLTRRKPTMREMLGRPEDLDDPGPGH